MDESIQDRDVFRWIEKEYSTCDAYEGVANANGDICCDPKCQKCGGSGCSAGCNDLQKTKCKDLCCGIEKKIFDVCGINYGNGRTKAPCLLKGIILQQLNSDKEEGIKDNITQVYSNSICINF